MSWTTLAVGGASFATYVATTAGKPYLLDSAELAAAAFGLGVPHPPGETLMVLLAKAFCLLPVGTIAFRVGLSQAAAGGAAAAVVFRLALRLGRALAGDRVGRAPLALVAAAAAFTFAFAPGVLSAAQRPEVYALQTALSLAALSLAVRGAAEGDARPCLLAGGLIGLGLANHPLVAGLTGVGAALAALPVISKGERSVRLRALAGSVAAVAIGLLVLAYLPVRTAALFASAPSGAEVQIWGDARSAAGFFWVLSAVTFTSKATVVHAAADPGAAPFVFIDEVGLVAALLAPAGLALMLARRTTRLPAIGIATAAAGAVLAAVVGGFVASNPDNRGYLGSAFALAAVLAAMAVVASFERVRVRHVQTALGAAVLALALGRVARVASEGALPNLRRASVADAIVGRLLADLPSRSALLTGYHETAFLVGYQQLVEGRRPDVAWAHLGFVRGPGYVERLSLAHPSLAAVLHAHRQAPLGRDAAMALTGDPTGLTARRSVRIEPHAQLGVDLRAALVPAGATWALDKPTLPADLEPLPEAAAQEAARDPQVRGFLAWRAYVDADLACASGFEVLGRLRIAELLRLLPEDRNVRALAARCGKPR